MCGFAGYYNLSKTGEVQEQLLNAMQEKISHRGPDDHGVWVSDDKQVGFSHRRLSIVDLSSRGHQPMLDAKNRVVISFNGEIYNYRKLRKYLEFQGYRFSSDTDTEVILYAYLKWGIDCIKQFDGMFAFSLFDLEKNELYLVRDRIGIKPHYFSQQNGVLSFASEIKALWELPWNKKEISSQAFYHYLTFMVTPAPYTMYKNVYKLPAGFYAKVSAHKEIEFHEWYSPLNPEIKEDNDLVRDEEYCIERVEQLLIASAKKRMVADVPVGAFLSGGVDSSLNVALMAQFTNKVKTFTVSFDDMPTDDTKSAERIAKKFGTDHHHITIGEKDAFDFYEKMVYHLDEPLADAVCVPFYFVAKLARDNGVKVVQVGEGADELFYGYPTYMRYKNIHDRFMSPLQKVLPKSVRKGIAGAVKGFFSKRPDYVELTRNWAEKRKVLWGGAIAFGEHQKEQVLNAHFLQDSGLFGHDSIVEKIYAGMNQGRDSFDIVSYHLKQGHKSIPETDFMRSLLYLELKQRLPELLLMRADKMSMAVSVEARVPFLDHQLVEFMLQVPPSVNCRNNQNKYLLKKVAQRYLPHDIVYRKKVGFAAPTERWYTEGNYFPTLFRDYANIGNKNNHFRGSVKDLHSSFNMSSALLAVQKWTLQNFWALK